ncbi:hypothetical protein PO909_032820 [Leuciscus waleckii]
MSQSGAQAREPSETRSQREQIRSHMKMVIEQLEGILKELKDVAHELRESLIFWRHRHLFPSRLARPAHEAQTTAELHPRVSPSLPNVIDDVGIMLAPAIYKHQDSESPVNGSTPTLHMDQAKNKVKCLKADGSVCV